LFGRLQQQNGNQAMKRVITLVALVFVLAGCANSARFRDEFFLVDESGKRHGPYSDFVHGDRVSVDGRIYTVFVPSVEKTNNAIGQKMRKIIIPHLEFRQAEVADVVAFLQTASVEYDIGMRKRKGVNFVLCLDPAIAAKRKIPLLTFKKDNMSLHDAVVLICDALDLKWSVAHSMVVIEFGEPDGPTSGSTSPSPASGLED
jgi:hypothetical protein